jgi:hypothetical protein
VNSNALAVTGAVAGGQAGAYSGLAHRYAQNARDLIGLYSNTTSGLASPTRSRPDRRDLYPFRLSSANGAMRKGTVVPLMN